MIKIAYGESNFGVIVKNDYFYQDRTDYIPKLEDYGGRYVMYLRPRRFGKSLMTSMLSHYYGLQYKSDFESLFGKLYIGQNPTKYANQYMILHFDFSAIPTKTEEGTFEGFTRNIKKGVETFFSVYKNTFTKEQQQSILALQEPTFILGEFLKHFEVNDIKNKIYVLIDEYDHFANELVSFNFHYFSQIVSQNGYVRKFYEQLKIATYDNTVERMFITGVSPLTMDSMTSGFNIATYLTQSVEFYNMMGFTTAEVKGILEKIAIKNDDLEQVMSDIKLWYDGYRFGRYHSEDVYNPNMVLYFAQEYQKSKHYPENWLDPNIASDYVKIKNLFNIQNNSEEFNAVLTALTEGGVVDSRLVPIFSLERRFNSEDLVSLLFYMGFLTIRAEVLGGYWFSFPNYVIQKLYHNYFLEIIAQQNDLPIDNRLLDNSIRTIAIEGNPKPFFEQVEKVVLRMSPKDIAHFNENSLKAIVISLLHQQNFYYLHTEYETDWKYMDIYLEAIRGYKVNFEVALELKYAAKAGRIALNTIFKNAAIQLRGYLETEKFKHRTKIRSWVVVVAGNKLHYKLLDDIKT